MYEALIEVQVMAMRMACGGMAPQRLMTLPDDLQRCPCSSAALPWARKATAHAEFFTLLADAVGDPVLAGILRVGAGCVRELAIAAGPTATGMVAGSHRRLLWVTCAMATRTPPSARWKCTWARPRRISATPRGLEDPMLNRGVGFTAAQREALGLTGRLPAAVLTLEQQALRAYRQLQMATIQVIASDMAVTMGGAEGNFELNAFRPVLISNYLHSAQIMADMCDHFRRFMIDGTELNRPRLTENIARSVTRPARSGRLPGG
jgi:hypothetical protein